MRMRRVFLGAGAIVMAMSSLALLTVRDAKAMTIGTKYNIPPRFKKKRGPLPRGRSAQRFDRSRLIVDRVSSFRKMRRWARAGLLDPMKPNMQALQRHGWHRRMMKQRRAYLEAVL